MHDFAIQEKSLRSSRSVIDESGLLFDESSPLIVRSLNLLIDHSRNTGPPIDLQACALELMGLPPSGFEG